MRRVRRWAGVAWLIWRLARMRPERMREVMAAVDHLTTAREVAAHGTVEVARRVSQAMRAFPELRSPVDLMGWVDEPTTTTRRPD